MDKFPNLSNLEDNHNEVRITECEAQREYSAFYKCNQYFQLGEPCLLNEREMNLSYTI